MRPIARTAEMRPLTVDKDFAKINGVKQSAVGGNAFRAIWAIAVGIAVAKDNHAQMDEIHRQHHQLLLDLHALQSIDPLAAPAWADFKQAFAIERCNASRILAEQKTAPHIPVAVAKLKTTKTDPPSLYALRLKTRDAALSSTLATAAKTLATHDWQLARDETRLLAVLDRIDALEGQALWPFKQLKQHIAPPRPATQWDAVVASALWLSTDFVQERKWKIAMAYTVAQWVVHWHATPDKSTICVGRPEWVLKKLASPRLKPKRKHSVSSGPGVAVVAAQTPAESLPTQTPAAITVHLQTNMYTITNNQESSTALSHLSTFSRPDPGTYDASVTPSTTQNGIVPVSKFQTAALSVDADVQWDAWGRLRHQGRPTVKWTSARRNTDIAEPIRKPKLPRFV